jgi:fibronectin type 3 domain-containing protein
VAPAGTVSGYRVYYGTASRSYGQALGGGIFTKTPSYTVSNLASGATYYFAVTAVDAAGVESEYSTERSKTMP